MEFDSYFARDTMNKMPPKERSEDELRAVSSAGPPGGLRTTEDDDRLLAAMAIADLANSLPAIVRSPAICLPGGKSLPPERVRQNYQPAKAPCTFAESVANMRTAVNLKRKMPPVTTSVNGNDNKVAKVTCGERWVTTCGDKWTTCTNGNCRSDSKCKGVPPIPSVLCNGSLNPTTGGHVKSLSGLLGDLGRQQRLNNKQMLVNNISSAQGNPSQTSRHPVCVVQPTVTFDEASPTETHPTILTCFSEPRPSCISTPIFKLELHQPRAGSFTVARPSGVKVEMCRQAATQNAMVTPTTGNIPVSSQSTITGVKSIVPPLTSVHIAHSSTDHNTKNPNRRNALMSFEDKKNVQMVGILTNHHIDATKLPLKKRKLHGAHLLSVSPIVVAPHESKGQVVALRTSAKEEQTVDRSASSLPPTKIRLVKVEQGKEGEGKEGEDASRQRQLAAGHESSKYKHS